MLAGTSSLRGWIVGLWQRLDFWLGLLTTLLILLAWSISIISQPLATVFGCSVALAGMSVAYVNYIRGRAPVVTPYLEDGPAKDTLKQAALLARKAKLTTRFVYRPQTPGAAARIWQIVHPRDVVLTPEHAAQFEEINPDRIRYELTPRGKVAHLLKRW